MRPVAVGATGMARALLVALWCATATTASCARYGDYSGARMPQYGGPEYEAPETARAHEPDDYRGRSPDAPAALDYKYEEDLAGVLSGKTNQPTVKEGKKDVEERDSWQRQTRKLKKKKSHAADEPSVDAHDRFDPHEDFPKPKSSNRFHTKHRPRLKSRKYDTEEDSEKYPAHEETQGYPINHRDKHDDIEMQGSVESVTADYHNIKRNILDNTGRYGRGERAARRKPRHKFERGSDRELDRGPDRELGRGLEDLGRELDRELDRGPDQELDKGPNRESDRESERVPESELEGIEKAESDVDRWMLMRGGLGRAPGPVADPFNDVEEERARRGKPELPVRKPLRQNTDEEDSDNVDRGQGGKGKGKKSKLYDDYNNDYYDMKRVMSIKNKLPSLLRRTTVGEALTAPARLATETRTGARARATEPVSLPAPSLQLQELLSNRRLFLPPPAATRTTLLPTETTAALSQPSTIGVIGLSTTTLGDIKALVNETKNRTAELTLAEKSRLSIMKKAMRKENMEGRVSTTKPPVLLQVTMKMPTVVMVEPAPGWEQPMLRAREVYADSPARLDKVKRLMRHKLVANARNIHDLTDNWDDLVCDYIDMSLLETVSAASRLNGAGVLLLMLFLLLARSKNGFLQDDIILVTCVIVVYVISVVFKCIVKKL